jgi:hypothetical protein
MTKKEAIEKVRAAAARVAKSVDYPGATVKALVTAMGLLDALKAEIVKEADIPSDMYQTLGGVWRIIDSICCGYPMIPAIPDVEKRHFTTKTESDFLEHAAGELEKAVVEKAEGAGRLAALGLTLAAWEAQDEGVIGVPVILPAQVGEVVKRAIVGKMAEAGKTAKAAAERAAADKDKPATASERLDAVAKAAATPAQAEAPVAAGAAHDRVTFGMDFNATRKSEAKA